MQERKVSNLTQLTNNIYSDLREMDISLDNNNLNTAKVLIWKAEDIIKQCEEIIKKCKEK